MNVIKTIESLGIDGDVRGNELVAACPAHKDRTGKPDNDPSWSINLDKGVHHCFSCGWKGSLKSLVKYMTGEDLLDEVDLRPGAMADVLSSLQDVDVEAQRYGSYRKVLPENSLAVFTEPPEDALRDRKVSGAACRDLGALWDHRSDSWILTIRDSQDCLLGWQVKSTRNKSFRNFPPGVPKRESLFGFSTARRSDFVVVVESPLDAVYLASYKVPAVATYGASVSLQQSRLLSMQWGLVISAFDNDAAGRKATKMLINSPSAINLCVMQYTDETKDPGEMPIRALLHQIRTAPSPFVLDL